MPKSLSVENLRSAEVYEPDDPVIQGRLSDAGKHRRSPFLYDPENKAIKCRRFVGFKAGQGAPKTPSGNALQELAESRGVTWTAEMKNRAVPYWASDERVDGEGDIIRQRWHFDEFEKNSPMPFNHKWQEPPVGKIIDWRIRTRKDADYEGPALWLLGLFATKDQWEWADTVFRLVESGVLPGGSVGFYSTKIVDIKDEEERAELGLGRFGFILDENHLLEFSPVTMPANPGAVTIQNCKGLLPHDMHMIRELKRLEIHGEHYQDEGERWAKTETMLLGIARTLWPNEEWEHHYSLDVPVILENIPKIGEADNTKIQNLDLIVAIESLTKRFDEFAASSERALDELRDQVTDLVARGPINTNTNPDDEESSEQFADDLSKLAETLGI